MVRACLPVSTLCKCGWLILRNADEARVYGHFLTRFGASKTKMIISDVQMTRIMCDETTLMDAAISPTMLWAEFCLFFLRTAIDQIDFMSGLLQLTNLSVRIERYLELELLKLTSKERERLGRLLKVALIEGEIDRGKVKEIAGQGDTRCSGDY